MPSSNDDDVEETGSPQAQTTLFQTPACDQNDGPEPRSAILSPIPKAVPSFIKHVIALLQRVVEGNDAAIEFGVSEFLRQYRITNKLGLSLLEEKDVPNGPADSIWTLPTFCKAFLTVCSGCADVCIG